MVEFGGASGRYDQHVVMTIYRDLLIEHGRAILRIARELDALRQ